MLLICIKNEKSPDWRLPCGKISDVFWTRLFFAADLLAGLLICRQMISGRALAVEKISRIEYHGRKVRGEEGCIIRTRWLMKIKRVWAVFFSPTGGTKKVTTTIAAAAAAALSTTYTILDFTLPQARAEQAVFGEGDLVILGTPVIAGRVPNLLLPYLREKLACHGAIGVPVVSFGNRDYDDALIELRNIMEDAGFQTAGGGAFVSEHSFSRTLGGGRPDATDIAALEEFGNKLAEKLQGDWQYSEAAYVKGENPIRPYFTPRDRHGAAIDIRKVKPKTGDACCSCGICVAACPMGAISSENPAEIPGTCMKCCACVKKCPVGAKYFDDAGFVYHKEELEEMYSRRAEPEYFL